MLRGEQTRGNHPPGLFLLLLGPQLPRLSNGNNNNQVMFVKCGLFSSFCRNLLNVLFGSEPVQMLEREK